MSQQPSLPPAENVPDNQPAASDQLPDVATPDLWSWAFHEDNLFDSRFDKFITIQALLVSAGAVIMQTSGGSRRLFPLMVIAIFGCVSSSLWLIIQARAASLLSSIQNQLQATSALYRAHKSRILPDTGQIWFILSTLGLVIAFWGVTTSWLLLGGLDTLNADEIKSGAQAAATSATPASTKPIAKDSCP